MNVDKFKHLHLLRFQNIKKALDTQTSLTAEHVFSSTEIIVSQELSQTPTETLFHFIFRKSTLGHVLKSMSNKYLRKVVGSKAGSLIQIP